MEANRLAFIHSAMGFANLTNRPESRPIALAVTSSVVALLTTLGHGALWADGRLPGSNPWTRFAWQKFQLLVSRVTGEVVLEPF
jgi:hypothetical protein